MMMKSFQIDFIDEINDVTNAEGDEINISISSIQQNLSKDRNLAVDKNNQSINSSFAIISFENFSSTDRFIRN